MWAKEKGLLITEVDLAMAMATSKCPFVISRDNTEPPI